MTNLNFEAAINKIEYFWQSPSISPNQLKDIFEALRTPVAVDQTRPICFHCGENVIDRLHVCKPKPFDPMRNPGNYDEELEYPKPKPEETLSLAEKLNNFLYNKSSAEDGLELAKIAESHYAKIIEDARYESYRGALNDKTNGNLESMLAAAREEAVKEFKLKLLEKLDAGL